MPGSAFKWLLPKPKPPLKPGSTFDFIFTDKVLQEFSPVQLAELRKISPGVRERVDVYSQKNLDNHLPPPHVE